jgi:Tol biopolymer transport system component
VRSAPADAPAIQLTFTLPKGTTLVDPRLGGPVTISPDGRLLVFAAIEADGAQRLWIRPIDSGSARPVPGTDGGTLPFWSPDSRFIGFFAQRKLKRVSVSGGAPHTLYDAIQPGGGTWAADGTIVFSAELGFQLYRGSEAGAVLTAIPADGLNRERWSPSFLPDGRHYVYFARPQKPGVYRASLDSTGSTPLLDSYRGVLAAAPGHVVAIRGSSRAAEHMTLFAQRLDPATFETVGESAVIAERVTYSSGAAKSGFSVSNTGTVVYTETENPAPRLTWFDRSGKAIEQLGGAASYYHPSLSPDGRAVVAERTDPETGSQDLWLIDLTRPTTPRLTYHEREDFLAVWSPDSTRIVFAAQPPGEPPNLFQKGVRDTKEEEHLVKSIYNSQPNSWSEDGRFVMFARRDPKSSWDLWRLDMGPGEARTETPYLRSTANEALAQFSPDGNRVAFVSDESGINEVYVDTFPAPGKRELISNGGGSQPRWRGDGRELFYIARDGRLMSVPVSPGPEFVPGAPTALFKTGVFDLNGAQKGVYTWNYAVTRDGQRFLISTIDDVSPGSSTTWVLLNWPARLRRP